ncbi:hypothetical protein K437DRAFT_120851 [Tilletiaria anomala UBC 951]|uniref:Uncharacterized protein n=1 Tax=Tilletiaria anomala (strain ATCC 24038 / CBS 436.72 / UBC 951) TaxID=1037660 RepID=A0A066VVS9_TILAU|nr:uncharacterized protein K437DRAFT_120851 [Tilletiaria anomala UBC 951]KDN45606.1 hypothetical protein K437DRAFT_120851 [Tilletiaria anomala UBC 951]
MMRGKANARRSSPSPTPVKLGGGWIRDRKRGQSPQAKDADSYGQIYRRPPLQATDDSNNKWSRVSIHPRNSFEEHVETWDRDVARPESRKMAAQRETTSKSSKAIFGTTDVDQISWSASRDKAQSHPEMSGTISKQLRLAMEDSSTGPLQISKGKQIHSKGTVVVNPARRGDRPIKAQVKQTCMRTFLQGSRHKSPTCVEKVQTFARGPTPPKSVYSSTERMLGRPQNRKSDVGPSNASVWKRTIDPSSEENGSPVSLAKRPRHSEPPMSKYRSNTHDHTCFNMPTSQFEPLIDDNSTGTCEDEIPMYTGPLRFEREAETTRGNDEDDYVESHPSMLLSDIDLASQTPFVHDTLPESPKLDWQRNLNPQIMNQYRRLNGIQPTESQEGIELSWLKRQGLYQSPPDPEGPRAIALHAKKSNKARIKSAHPPETPNTRLQEYFEELESNDSTDQTLVSTRKVPLQPPSPLPCNDVSSSPLHFLPSQGLVSAPASPQQPQQQTLSPQRRVHLMLPPQTPVRRKSHISSMTPSAPKSGGQVQRNLPPLDASNETQALEWLEDDGRTSASISPAKSNVSSSPPKGCGTRTPLFKAQASPQRRVLPSSQLSETQPLAWASEDDSGDTISHGTCSSTSPQRVGIAALRKQLRAKALLEMETQPLDWPSDESDTSEEDDQTVRPVGVDAKVLVPETAHLRSSSLCLPGTASAFSPAHRPASTATTDQALVPETVLQNTSSPLPFSPTKDRRASVIIVPETIIQDTSSSPHRLEPTLNSFAAKQAPSSSPPQSMLPAASTTIKPTPASPRRRQGRLVALDDIWSGVELEFGSVQAAFDQETFDANATQHQSKLSQFGFQQAWRGVGSKAPPQQRPAGLDAPQHERQWPSLGEGMTEDLTDEEEGPSESVIVRRYRAEQRDQERYERERQAALEANRRQFQLDGIQTTDGTAKNLGRSSDPSSQAGSSLTSGSITSGPDPSLVKSRLSERSKAILFGSKQ